jgi:hypothetical protein
LAAKFLVDVSGCVDRNITATCRQILDDVENLSLDYNLATVGILSDYYKTSAHDEEVTKKYYKKISIENFSSRIDEIVMREKTQLCALNEIFNSVKAPKSGRKGQNNVDLTSSVIAVVKIEEAIASASNTNINIGINVTNYDMCKCGAKAILVPEASEIRCVVPECGRIKIIKGSILKEEPASCDSQKSKCNGYDFSRHFKFWMERLQALEHKVFSETELGRIKICILRDRITPNELNCIIIRSYLKEVGLTEYNDHVPLLVKMFGGRGPPQFTFQEVRSIAIKFNKIINLYHKVNPTGSNRPYYPYFIYKIVEQDFKDNPDKLRLLDFIHLQSDDTIKKNDGYYEQICALAAPEDGLIYSVTNPYERCLNS